MVMVPFSLSQLTLISSSSRPFMTSGAVTLVKRTLSRASDALEMSSRRKTFEVHWIERAYVIREKSEIITLRSRIQDYK